MRDLEKLTQTGLQGRHVSKRALRQLHERHMPPVPKPPALVAVKAAPKPLKAARKPRKHIFVPKSYDAAIKYRPPVEAPHPVSQGMRTLMMGVGG